METNFTFTLDGLKRISSNQEGGLELAENSTAEMLVFVESKKALINEFVDLTQVMSSNARNILNDCLTAINHVFSALKELKNHFSHSMIIDPFDITCHKVEKIKNDAEEAVIKLLNNLSEK